MTVSNKDIPIAKTIKLFINGEFPRTESGRTFPVYYWNSKKLYANICQASRKDFRNSVNYALKAKKIWAARSAYNRGQILYRMAEMFEAKRYEFINILKSISNYDDDHSNSAIDASINSFIYYAGFADKYQQLITSINPVSGPYHNFTTVEPIGLVTLFASKSFNLPKLISQISAIIVSGNSLIVILPHDGSVFLSALAEVFATSDLPNAVVNLLSGNTSDLLPHIASHMELDAVSYQSSDQDELTDIKKFSIHNLKRITSDISDLNSLEHILKFIEYKTIWHPIGS